MYAKNKKIKIYFKSYFKKYILRVILIKTIFALIAIKYYKNLPF